MVSKDEIENLKETEMEQPQATEEPTESVEKKTVEGEELGVDVELTPTTKERKTSKRKNAQSKEQLEEQPTKISTEKKLTAIQDLPGVGPSTAAKLEEAGYRSLEAIAAAPVDEIAGTAGIGTKTAKKMIEAAMDALEYTFESAADILEKRKQIHRISTGSQSLDELFGSGIETGSITELYGEYRTGKTQLVLQLCVTAQLPVSEGGLQEDGEDVKSIYVDTEGTFRPERILSICERYSEFLEPEKVLKNIYVARAFNSDHQMVLAEKALQMAQQEKVGLLVVDSLIAHFRAEYIGRGTLASRQQKLNSHIHTLLRAGEVGNMAVVVTNQVHAKPDVFFGDATKPVGGHIIAHAAHTRVYLRKSKGNRRVARIADSPLLPESETVFTITEQGILDP
ncbi:MAG: DNA repair and recombination protein RadA [Candidatus Hermodarchaeota archaeon]